jgi:hypothetical protein
MGIRRDADTAERSDEVARTRARHGAFMAGRYKIRIVVL